jgi:hypothetical protein
MGKEPVAPLGHHAAVSKHAACVRVSKGAAGKRRCRARGTLALALQSVTVVRVGQGLKCHKAWNTGSMLLNNTGTQDRLVA